MAGQQRPGTAGLAACGGCVEGGGAAVACTVGCRDRLAGGNLGEKGKVT